MQHMMKRLILLLFVLFYNHMISAKTIGPIFDSNKIVASISAGPTWTNAGMTQTFYLQPDFPNTYAANQSTQILAEGELFLGIQRSIHPLILGQLGFAVATSSNTPLTGDVWEAADPTFDNFTYTYFIRHSHVAVKGKLLTEYFNPSILPYVEGSLGAGFNGSSHFSETPLIFQAIPAPNFRNNYETSFTYTVGIGVQKVLDPHWQAGIGYEFADWGRSSLKSAPGQTLGSGLSLNHFYTNQLQFTISYLA